LRKTFDTLGALVKRQFVVLLLFVLHHYGQRVTGEDAAAAQIDGGAIFHQLFG
jgi:hypothetical protein